jgi:hypothetical protein
MEHLGIRGAPERHSASLKLQLKAAEGASAANESAPAADAQVALDVEPQALSLYVPGVTSRRGRGAAVGCAPDISREQEQHVPRGLKDWAVVALAVASELCGCAAPPRYHERYQKIEWPQRRIELCDLELNTVSSTVRRQPDLLLKLQGEEQVINPAWLGWQGAAVGAAVAAGVVAAVELSRQEQQALEEALQACAQQAELEVNQRELLQNGLPKPEDCYMVVGTDEFGNAITLAMVLGEFKHQAALKCVAEKVAPRFPGRILIQPRYRYFEGSDWTEYVSPAREEWLLSQRLYGELTHSFFPDIVIILDVNPYRIQAVYDYKFPCVNANGLPEWSQYPDRSVFAGMRQWQVYKAALKQTPKRVTPRKIEE